MSTRARNGARRGSKTGKVNGSRSPIDGIKGSAFVLGDKKSQAAFDDAHSSEEYLKVDMDSDINIFAIVHPSFIGVRAHWVEIGDQVQKVVCGAHATEDPSIIANRWGYPEGCPICAIKANLYENAPKESVDPVHVASRKLAARLSANYYFYMFVVKGDAEIVRASGGKKQYKPFFEKEAMIPRKLQMSQNSFNMLRNALEEEIEDSDKMIGAAVQFITGKSTKGNGDFSQTNSVKVLKTGVEVPDFRDLSFGDMTKYHADQAEKVAAELTEVLDDLISGLVRSSKSKGKSKAKSATTKTRRRTKK